MVQKPVQQQFASKGGSFITSYKSTLTFICFLVIREVAEEAGTSGSHGGKNISLKNTTGPPVRLEVSPKNKPNKGVSISALKDWMKKDGICLAQMRRNGKFIRKQFGRQSIEKYAREALQQESHNMDEFFHTEEFSFIERKRTEVRGKLKTETREFKRFKT